MLKLLRREDIITYDEESTVTIKTTVVKFVYKQDPEGHEKREMKLVTVITVR